MPILALLSLPFACANAYLDPGTGSLLLSSIVAIFASFVYFFKNIFYRAKAGRLGLSSIAIGGGGETTKKLL